MAPASSPLTVVALGPLPGPSSTMKSRADRHVLLHRSGALRVT